MTTRMECYLSDIWPADAQLRKDAIALGFAESGRKRPRTYFRDGRVDMDNLFAAFDELDSTIPAWVPLSLDFQHKSWLTKDDGPISGAAYLRLQQFVAFKMHERYQRLILNFGAPQSYPSIVAKAGKLWSCAGMSAYRRLGDSAGVWLAHARRIASIASPFELPMMLYVSPTMFPKSWKDPGVPMNDGKWGLVLDYCDEVRAADPTTMFSFWQNRDSDDAGFTDEYLLGRLAEMKERLG